MFFSAALMVLAAAIHCRGQSASASIQFKYGNYPVRESVPAAVITVIRLGSVTGTASVEYTTLDESSDGTTATPDVDYTPARGTLTFGPGVSSLTFTVPIKQDLEDELDEKVTLELMNPSGGAELGGRANATLTITDDDVCTYVLSPTGLTHGPEGGSGGFNVNVLAGCPWTVTKPTGADWIGVFTSSGFGTTTVLYSVDQNTSTSPRRAALKVAGQSFTVTQNGVPPPDLTKPLVAILTPGAGTRVTNLPFTVTGKASDAGGVTRVEFLVENSAGTNEFWTPADGTSTWTATVDGLRPGLNTVRVRAHDASGNISSGTARSFNFVVVSPLSLLMSFEGASAGGVTGARDGQFLDVGRTYSVTATATPAKTNLFAGWGGDIVTNAARITFTMRSNLALVAKFVPNPFLPFKGSHHGLFSQPGEAARHESSGFISATVTDLGAYTAKLTLAGKVTPFSGRFALDGSATNDMERPGLNPLSIRLTLEGGSITGSINEGNWEAALSADRTGVRLADPPPLPGRYNLVFPGNDDPAHGPHGFSFASATVDAAGRIRVVASLSDGTTFSQGTTLSDRRRWPLFGRLYGGSGQILGWMQLPDEQFPAVGRAGSCAWFKMPVPQPKYYPDGFTLLAEISGARYDRTVVTSTPFLSFTGGELAYGGGLVDFSGGNVTTAFTNVVRVDPGNKVVGLGTIQQGTNRLTLAYSLSSGAFGGSVTVPGTTRPIPFKGSLYGGFFLGSNECGRVLLRAAP